MKQQKEREENRIQQDIPGYSENALSQGLQLDSLMVGYGKKVVLDGVTLAAEPGRILTLIGPNGSGKSTILKSIIGQLKPLGGIICLEGRRMQEMTGAEIAKSLSMVMTERPDPELMSCREVAATGRYPYVGALGILAREDWQKVDEALQLMQAQELANEPFSEISDGQRQRVMLARAFCQEPKVLVLDEPTSFLDMKYKLELLTCIRRMATEKNIAVLMSLHELELAMKVSDSVACVDGEKISLVGTPEEIFQSDIIQRLYQVENRCFQPLTGAMYLAGTSGRPEVFVIGGGGAGIPVYHKLQRAGIPFAAGILMENDVEYSEAAAVAGEVVATRAFYPAAPEHLERAKKLIDSCMECICVTEEFGPYNRENRELMEYAQAKGKLVMNIREGIR